MVNEIKHFIEIFSEYTAMKLRYSQCLLNILREKGTQHQN